MVLSIDDYKRQGLLILLGVADVGQSIQDLEYDFYKGVVEGTVSLGAGAETVSGRYFQLLPDSNSSTGTLPLNREHGFLVPLKGSVTSIGIKITTAADGGVVRLGIRPYDKATGQGTSPVWETTIAATSIGTFESTGDITLTNGLWLFTYTAQGYTTTGPSLQSAITDNIFGGISALAANLATFPGFSAGHGPRVGFQNGITGALPATWINVSTTNVTPPVIWLKG